MAIKTIKELIGNTPLVKLEKLAGENAADVYVKLEKFNIGGSVKDRAVLGMLTAAEKEGLLKPGSIIVEPTSGNTGIAMAMIGNMMGYAVKITMPETMSKERRDTLAAYGAELILTPGDKGMRGAIEEAERLSKENPHYFFPMQFSNPNNPAYHYETTGKEIIDDIPDVDAFVSGVGTGGTITGVSRRLKEHNPLVYVLGVEPSNSPVLSGGAPGPHKIQGIGAGFIPKNYDGTLVDATTAITDAEAFEFTKQLAKVEGLFLGISSGGAILAAVRLAKEMGVGKKIVVIAPDGGEKYLSMNVF